MTTTHLTELERRTPSPRIATGRVTQAPRGTPVADVLVSDGHAFARTNAAGRYQLSLAAEARWVQVINPPGSLPDAMLYSLLSSAGESHQADFTLRPIDRPADQAFPFVYLTDSHVASPSRGQRLRMEFVDAINRMNPSPAFVIDGGDTCINSADQLEIAAGVNQGYRMPYLATIGNHDRPRREAFEAHARPSYHAFTYHNYLILSLPWLEELEQAYHWTRQLLETMGKPMHVLVSLHHPEGLHEHHSRFMELFRTHEVLAMLSGHYHVNHAREHAGIPLYILRGAVARNSDAGRPVFTVIHATPQGRLRIEQRDVDCHQELRLLTPQRSDTLIIEQPCQLWVHAYDSAVRVRDMHASFHDAGSAGLLLGEVKFEQVNAHLWTASYTPQAHWRGNIYLTIEATDAAGQAWKPIHVLRTVGDAQPDNAGAATVKWVQASEGSFNFGSAALHEDLLIAGVECLAELEREQPILMAMDATSGQVRWTFSMAGAAVRSTPLVHRGLVIAQLDDGRVLCVEAATGRQRWLVRGLHCDSQLTQIFSRCSPIAANDDELIVGGNEAYQRLSLHDGQVIWSQHCSNSHRGSLPPSPVLAEGRLVAVQRQSLRVVDACDASLQWELKVLHNHTRPLVHEGVIYTIVREQGQTESPWSPLRWRNDLIALDLATGNRRWSTPLTHLGEAYSSPVVHDDLLLVVDYDALLMVDRAAGSIRHRIDLSQAVSEREYLISNDLCSAAMYPEARSGLVTGTPVVQGQHLYLVTIGGTVVSINLTHRQIAWSHPLHMFVNASPVAAGNQLYVTGHHGGIIALTHQDNRPG